MRLLTLALALALAVVPVMAQDAPKAGETPAEKAEAPKMSEEGSKLFSEVKTVYAKYYEIILAKAKSNEEYKADEVWDAAVKEVKDAAGNPKYKDRTEFHDAVAKMKAKDRIFRKEVNELVTKHAKEFAEAVRKHAEEKEGG